MFRRRAPLAVARTARNMSGSQIRSLPSAEVRERFLAYYEREHAHTRLPASSLLPSNDPSLLFTNAGMVQFKDIFTGAVAPGAVRRATTAQRCLRAGGKHNDLDNVGHTARHHTLFEMLGNFSFADYGAELAVESAWRFVTDARIGLGLPRERLRVSVLRGDTRTAAVWRRVAGAGLQVVECAPSDNFWSMGDGPGPCGPCTEIFFDQGREVDGDRWLELWNLVLMQNQRDAAGQLHTLAHASIDTGMGLERVAAVLQGVPTNFDADCFQPLVDAALDALRIPAAAAVRGVHVSSERHVGLTDAHRTALKVVVDHARAACALIADGVLPAAAGRGYVLRRIIRRAVRYATHTLGATAPVLCHLVPAVVASQAALLPHVTQRAHVVEAVLRAEEEAFLGTLKRGERVLHDELAKLTTRSSAPTGADGSLQLPAHIVHELYDRYGFPVDLTALILRERNQQQQSASGSAATATVPVTFDQAAVDALIGAQRAASREAWRGSGDAAVPAAVRAWASPPLAAHTNGDVTDALGHVPDAVPRTSLVSVRLSAAEVQRACNGAAASSKTTTSASVSDSADDVALSQAFARLPGGDAEREWCVAARVLNIEAVAAAAAAGTAAGTGASTGSESASSAPMGVWVQLDTCPFYAQGGGQVGDRGFLEVVAPAHAAHGARFAVLDTQRVGAGAHGAVAVLISQFSSPSSSSAVSNSVDEANVHDALTALAPANGASVRVLAVVDGARRRAAAVHHTATHALHAALQRVLGAHVTQARYKLAGSRVAPEGLRFDYTHSRTVTAAQLAAIEAEVNAVAVAALPVHVEHTTHADATGPRLQAKALFSEKYGDRVRVVSFGDRSRGDGLQPTPAQAGGDAATPSSSSSSSSSSALHMSSAELCGGSHAPSTRSLFPFVIRSEASIGAGARRIEAVAGEAGAALALQHARSLRKVADSLGVAVHQVEARVAKLLDRHGAPLPPAAASSIASGGDATHGGTTVASSAAAAVEPGSVVASHIGAAPLARSRVRVALHVVDASPLGAARAAAQAAQPAAASSSDKGDKAERKAAGRLLQAALRAQADQHAKARAAAAAATVATEPVSVHVCVCGAHVGVAVGADAGGRIHALHILNALLASRPPGGAGGGKADNAQGAWTSSPLAPNATAPEHAALLTALEAALVHADAAGALEPPRL